MSALNQANRHSSLTLRQPIRCSHVRWSPLLWVLLSAAGLAIHSPAHAKPDHADASINAQAMINPQVLNNATGIIAVNQTSGIDNVQANHVLLINNATASPNSGVTSIQHSVTAARVNRAQAVIADGAFSNTSGMIAINQSAGAGNLQQNSAVIGSASVEAAMVADSTLYATVAKNGSPAGTSGNQGVREAFISASAFQNVSGVLQVNQAVGVGNLMTNSFVLRPPAGTFF